MTPRVLILVFDQFQLLDASGPASAFELAGTLGGQPYALRVVAERKGLIASSAGIAISAHKMTPVSARDTLIVAGGAGVDAAARDLALLDYIRTSADGGSRVVSICTGAFLLAAAGLLNGRRATTHWSRGRELGERFPAIDADPDRIYVQSGSVWTSAGISAGIDLALALVAEDQGEELARRVARELVLPFRRSGGQSQFSALMEMQRLDGPFATLLEEIRVDPGGDHSVEELAQRARMSTRTFTRRFTSEIGVSPAKAVEKLRCEAAKTMLDAGATAKDAARAAGFGDNERMRRAFLRTFDTGPAQIKRQRVGSTVFEKL